MLLVLNESEYRAFRLEEARARRRSEAELQKVYAKFDQMSEESRRTLYDRSQVLAHSNRESFLRKVEFVLRAVRRRAEGRRGITPKDAAPLLRRIFKEHLVRAYRYGRYSRIGAAAFSPSNTTAQGEKYIKDAAAKQMDYMQKYVKKWGKEGYKGLGLKSRIKMYAGSLETAYDEGRLSVVADAPNIIIEWMQDTVGRGGMSCESCIYLRRQLFLKSTLPCVPKDGTTLCLSNCRDILVVRKAIGEDELERAGETSKEQHLQRLQEIRRRVRPNSYF